MIVDIMGFIGNMCVVLITIYTFYLTFFSRKIKIVGCGITNSVFEGCQIHFSLHSHTLQSFEVSEMSVIFQDQSVRLKLEEPVIIEPRMTTKIIAERYTRLTENIDLDDIMLGKNWGLILRTQNNIIYTSIKKWDLGIRKKHKYRKGYYHRVGTINQIYGETVISDMVKYVIWIRLMQYDKPIFMTEDGRMSQTIEGYNGIEDVDRLSLKQIRKQIAKLLGVSKKYIVIEDVALIKGDEPLEIQLLDENGEDILEGMEIGDFKMRK